MNRLFTFGCSLTNYHYPTWADILSKNYTEFQNWGRPGAGNNFILNSLVECHLRNKLTADDTVIVLWSGLSRIDYFQINEWSHLHHRYYDLKNKELPYSCPDGYQLLSFGWMTSAVSFLKNIGTQWKMLHWQDLDKDTQVYQLYSQHLDAVTYAPFELNDQPYKLSSHSLMHAEDLYQRLAGPDWPALNDIINGVFKTQALPDSIKQECEDFLTDMEKDKRIVGKNFNEIDLHPSPLKHLSWIRRYFPHAPVTADTVAWLTDIDQRLLSEQSYKFIRSKPTRF